MNRREHAAHSFFLNALVALNKTMEVRTRVLSERNLDSLLNEPLAALALSRSGALEADRLLGTYLENDALFPAMAKGRPVQKWRCYAQKPGERYVALVMLMDKHALHSKVAELELKAAMESKGVPLCVLLPDIESTPAREERLTSVLTELFACSPGKLDSVVAVKASDETSERETLKRIRGDMLDAVGSFTSEELAAAANSITSNASQFAADQRNAGKLFGVRFGSAWHYPKFQFDSKRNTIPEMKDVLTALSPDEQGWDRLQWFLTPHEKLKGRTPLQVWKTDRQKVVEAANVERWNGRD
jgi:hypothetical protein